MTAPPLTPYGARECHDAVFEDQAIELVMRPVLRELAEHLRDHGALDPPTLRLIRRLDELIVRGYVVELPALRTLDDVTRALDDYQRNGAGPKAPSARAIASRLRGPLRALAGGTPLPMPGGGADTLSYSTAQIHALRDVAALAREHGRERLLCDAVAHHLARGGHERAERQRARWLGWLHWLLDSDARPEPGADTTADVTRDHAER